MHVTLQRWRLRSGLTSISYHVRAVDGEELAAHDAQVPRTGASTTKLLTIDAALRRFGPDHRFTVEVLHDGDRLILRGCNPWLQPRDMVGLAANVSRHAAELLLDDSRYPPFVVPRGWREDSLPLDVQPVMPMTLREYFGHDPAAAVAEALAGTLTAQGHPTRYRGRGSAGGEVVGRLASATLLDLAIECLHSSHNLMAEILGRETAISGGLPPTFDSLQTSILTGLPVDTEGIRLRDASGLSTGNRLRADVLTHVLHTWLDGPLLDQAALPLAGLTGTLSAVNDWFQTPSAGQVRGYIRAKSGTRTDCVALAGCTFAPQRPLRVFAILVDGLPGPAPNVAVRRQVEEFARLVALAPGPR